VMVESPILGEILCVEGDTFCLSGATGQVRPGSDQGLFIHDTRVLNSLMLHIDGHEPAPLAGSLLGAGAARFVSSSFGADRTEDPTLFVDRRRVVADSMVDEIRVTNYAVVERPVTIEVFASTDFAYIFDVKHGRTLDPAPATAVEGALRFDDRQADRAVVIWPTPPADVVDADRGRLCWNVTLPAGGSWSVNVAVGFSRPGWATTWPTRTWALATEQPHVDTPPPWSRPTVTSTNPQLERLVDRSMTDLASLVMTDPDHPGDFFLAAGSPWYLTLFGRDSLWAARMLLPVGTDLAHSTLRVLARRQGRHHDEPTEEAPGKILHEVRHGGLVERSDLPPIYYGSVDATLLWVITLSEAWHWGLADEAVEPLLPALERALQWVATDGDADGDGFLEYASSGALANQGWKDSHDAIQFADGTLAEPPIALCEVQGYAHDAAQRAAELIDHFGRRGADRWRGWADELRERFRAAFWVEDPAGDYPAIALDGRKRKVDAVGSNMGHLPGTGIVDEAEIQLIAARLCGPDMASGWGLRTLSAASPRFNPLSYHGGSVWPHDSAIAAANLAAAGHGAAAERIACGLIDASATFRNRLPELFSGEQRSDGMPPLPYPAACRPQAWSAAAAVMLVRCLLGVDPHVPARTIRLQPVWPPPFSRLDVSGLQVAGQSLSLSVLEHDGVWIAEQPDGFVVEVVGAPQLGQPPRERRRGG
jgi:glycogen debranching enzyme